MLLYQYTYTTQDHSICYYILLYLLYLLSIIIFTRVNKFSVTPKQFNLYSNFE